MLEKIPDPIKRERRRDVIEKGLDSAHFRIAIARMLELFADMEKTLAAQPWLVGDHYTIADAAFTPYVVRLDHLDLIGLLDRTPRVAGWYRRLQQRPSFQTAITRWENADYLALMKRAGRESWPKIQTIMREL